MSDTEDFDITKSIGANEDPESSDFDSGSEASDFGGFGDEVQDEILSDDDDENDNGKEETGAFPSLELSDDESAPKKKREEDLDSYFAAPTAKKSSSGTFGAMGLSKMVQVNISKKGFRQPTPIQRKTVPLALEGKDLVGMARTGSGKTAAFVLPMLERLKVHSAVVGARALILSPSREVALQTLKAVKDFGKGSDLRTALLVGGDSLEDQFGYMMSNPDIIIATPGRLWHLKTEMQLDLKSIEYAVFDEADQLFEQGLAEQLDDILASLATSRQTLLFSATLPSTLVEFAKAGLHDPVLIRLDSETKVSEDLQMAFFAIKDGEREAALSALLQDVIKMPLMSDAQRKYLQQSDQQTMQELSDDDNNEKDGKKNNKKKFKRERLPRATDVPTPESTILFVPTKHHVEYYAAFLQEMGYAVSYSYSTLHQTARKEQLYRFRAGKTSIFVVTDVAARGIDVPLLANVVNLTLPSNPKVFVHRVGRTARAGQRGWAYTLVREQELPYLMDLELFLSRKLLMSHQIENSTPDYTHRLIVGSFPRENLEVLGEHITKVLKGNYDLDQMQQVAARGEKQYLKSITAASRESVKRSKAIVQAGWTSRHVMFGKEDDESAAAEELLARIANRKKRETVFEYKKTHMEDSAAMLMARRRSQLAPVQRRAQEVREKRAQELQDGAANDQQVEMFRNDPEENAPESELTQAFQDADQVLQQSYKKRKRDASFRDEQFFMSHFAPASSASDRGYNVNGGFAENARQATFNLAEDGKDNTQKQGMRWDKKKGKYVNAGSADGVKYIRGEDGRKIPASLRSGRFDKWKAAHKAGPLKVGAREQDNVAGAKQYSKFKHHKVEAPRKADRARDDFHKQKKKVDAAMDKGMEVKGMRNNKLAKSGIQSTEDVRKFRELKEKRREKNARGNKKGGKGKKK